MLDRKVTSDENSRKIDIRRSFQSQSTWKFSSSKLSSNGLQTFKSRSKCAQFENFSRRTFTLSDKNPRAQPEISYICRVNIVVERKCKHSCVISSFNREKEKSENSRQFECASDSLWEIVKFLSKIASATERVRRVWGEEKSVEK